MKGRLGVLVRMSEDYGSPRRKERPFLIVRHPRPLANLSTMVEQLARWGLIAVALVVLIYAAREWSAFFVPLMAALVIGLMFSPALSVLEEHSVPSVVAVAILLSTMGGILFAATMILWDPVSTAINQVPDLLHALRKNLGELSGTVEDLTGIESGENAAGGQATPEEQLDINQRSLLDLVLATAPPVLAQLLFFIGAVVFFLATRNRLRSGILSLCFSRVARLRAARIMRDTETNISRYLLTIAAINIALGVTVGLVMTIAGLEAPVMWGVLAATLNFIPYIGPMIMMVLLFAAGITAELSWSEVFLPVGLYAVLNFVEYQFVTPAILGKSLTLNPFMVFLSIAFWFWLWGPVGAFLAVPLLLISVVALKHFLPSR
jgi:predicted PurR-regulated permease PerM